MKLKLPLDEYIYQKQTKKRCGILYKLLLEEFDKYREICDESKKLNIKDHFMKKEIEEKILKLIDEDDSVLTIVDNFWNNIGMTAADLGIESVALRALDNEKASIQQNKNKKTIGMIAAYSRLENVVDKALDNEKACTLQDYSNQNLGCIVADFLGNEQLTIKALSNETASLQQDVYGKNIGMYAARRQMPEATMFALDNKIASIQQDEDGKNIGMIAAEYGLDDCVLKALENEEARNQKSNDIWTMGILTVMRQNPKSSIKCLDYRDVLVQYTTWQTSFYSYAQTYAESGNNPEFTEKFEKTDFNEAILNM